MAAEFKDFIVPDNCGTHGGGTGCLWTVLGGERVFSSY